jgi:hypothetical protein
LNLLPGKSHTVDGTRSKVFDHHVTMLDELGKDLFALGILGVQREAALVVVQHCEVEAVHIRNILQLSSRSVSNSRSFHLYYISTKPCEQLGASRPRLNMGHIQNTDTFQSFCHYHLYIRIFLSFLL